MNNQPDPNQELKSPPARVVWIEILENDMDLTQLRLSPPARVVWIEIGRGYAAPQVRYVATREGGVD